MATAAPVLERPTLILNKDWVPIQTTTTRKAIALVVNGSAQIIDPVTYAVHDLLSWDALSRTREAFEEARIRSERLSIAPPEVILLTTYHGLGVRSVIFSRSNLFKRDRFTCQYCGVRPRTAELTIDHIVPRRHGGKSSGENCVVACFRCNGRMADRTPDEASMKLRTRPKKPSWRTIFRAENRVRCESWKKFVDAAYWETELEG